MNVFVAAKLIRKVLLMLLGMPLTELHSFIRSMDLSLIKLFKKSYLRLEALIISVSPTSDEN